MSKEVHHEMKFKIGQFVRFKINNRIIEGSIIGCAYVKGKLEYRIKPNKFTDMKTEIIEYSCPPSRIEI